jgi:hypothetical protein
VSSSTTPLGITAADFRVPHNGMLQRALTLKPGCDDGARFDKAAAPQRAPRSKQIRQMPLAQLCIPGCRRDRANIRRQ